eukprot:2950135-Prymnesium_polylepis.1
MTCQARVRRGSEAVGARRFGVTPRANASAQLSPKLNACPSLRSSEAIPSINTRGPAGRSTARRAAQSPALSRRAARQWHLWSCLPTG